jgi:hypothetical protein
MSPLTTCMTSCSGACLPPMARGGVPGEGVCLDQLTEWAWAGAANHRTIDLALHVLDEVIHHGAEVGLLRDLYFRRSSLPG